MGALGYADDIVIIVPTVCSLKSMLHICDDFGKEFHVKFNSNKYQFSHYPCTTNTTVDNLIYDNHLIKCQSIATHLGHTIGIAAKTKAIEDGIDKFIVALNGIIATFKYAYGDVKYKLLKTYCMSLYECILWNLGSRSIRKLLRLPLRTHSKYLPLIWNDLSVHVQLFKRLNKFLNKALCNSNVCVKTCVHLVINGSGSSVSERINVVSQSMNCNRNLLYAPPSVFSSKVDSYIHRIYIAPDYFCVGNIKDLLYIRDSKCSQFNSFELTCLLEHFSTS